MTHTAIWLLLGLLTVTPLLGLIQQTNLAKTGKILSLLLVAAALVYVGFALQFGDSTWLSIEALSVVIYGGFCGLASRVSWLWLAIGWLLHPVWDLLHLLGPGHYLTPDWYAVACIAFDLAIAAYVVYRVRAEQPQGS